LEFIFIPITIALLFFIVSLKRKIKSYDIIQDDSYILKSKIKELEERESAYKMSASIFEERKAELEQKEEVYLKTIKDLDEKFVQELEGRKKVTSQKKSSEVRLGHIAETLAPFLDQFEFEPEECSFLGQPIDYVSFGQKEITFIEIKSGNSQLSSKQRRIRDQVIDGKVAWKEVRIK